MQFWCFFFCSVRCGNDVKTSHRTFCFISYYFFIFYLNFAASLVSHLFLFCSSLSCCSTAVPVAVTMKMFLISDNVSLLLETLYVIGVFYFKTKCKI